MVLCEEKDAFNGTDGHKEMAKRLRASMIISNLLFPMQMHCSRQGIEFRRKARQLNIRRSDIYKKVLKYRAVRGIKHLWLRLATRDAFTHSWGCLHRVIMQRVRNCEPGRRGAELFPFLIVSLPLSLSSVLFFTSDRYIPRCD
jgi:hypothetical protein